MGPAIYSDRNSKMLLGEFIKYCKQMSIRLLIHLLNSLSTGCPLKFQHLQMYIIHADTGVSRMEFGRKLLARGSCPKLLGRWNHLSQS